MDEVFKETSQFYDEQADSFEEKTKDKQKRHWLDRFVAAMPKKVSVLDIGCAYGRDLRTFADLGFVDVVGIDGSTTMLDKASVLVPEAELHNGDARQLPFPDGRFDGVWASAVFVHIPKRDMPGMLREIARCLAGNGVLYGSLYLGDSEGMEQDTRYASASKYYSYFSLDEFRSLLTAAGFEIIAFEPRPKDEYERADILEFLARKK